MPWPTFAIALLAVSGSLYYSESAGFAPCELCWYQRIAMYPLALLLFVGGVARDPGLARYVLPLSATGAAISIYHYQLQLFPEQGESCAFGVPCTFRYVEQFGFVSIPFMAFCGFAAIFTLTLLQRLQELRAPLDAVDPFEE